MSEVENEKYTQRAGQLDTQTLQMQWAYVISLELWQNFGPEGYYRLADAGTRPQLVALLRDAAKNCENCDGIRFVAKASGTPLSQLGFPPIQGKHYGFAVMEAAESYYQAQSSDDDDGGEGGSPPVGEDGGAEAGEEGGAEAGEEGGAEAGEEGGAEAGAEAGDPEPPDETSPLECLSWWGEHIGNSGDDNGGLPPTSFPPDTEDPTAGCDPLGPCPLP